MRILTIKLEIDWKQESGKQLYNRLRDLSWQAAHYRNSMIRRKWAESMGWRVDPEAQDKHDITKQGRKTDKGELSGDAYSSCEQEVQAAWTRDAKRILAGQPLPEWKPTSALSITGKENQKDSGIRLEFENGQYVLYLRLQRKETADGSWLRLLVAKNTKRDEYQAPLLDRMSRWETPIKKTTIHIKQHEILARLTYSEPKQALPPMGERVATLGPISREGRLLLRTETQTRDYTAKLAEVRSKKDSWDLIRRRVLCQIGRRHGHARIKRERLAHLSWDNWLQTYLHTWTRDAVRWCQTQGIGTIRIDSIETGDWPAHRFTDQLKYKAADVGMAVESGIQLSDQSGDRAVKSIITKAGRKAKRRADALRELTHQIKESA